MSAWLGSFKERRRRERNAMQFNLALDYYLTEQDKAPVPRKEGDPLGGGWARPRLVTDWLVTNSIAGKYPQGSKVRAEQRCMAAVKLALKKAKETSADEISLSEDQFDFVVKALDEWSVPAGVMDWFVVLQDYCEGLKRQLAGAKNTPTPSKA